MASQRMIENAAGIDEKVAAYIMKQETSAAQNAMRLLKMCVDCYEVGAATLLKCAVEDCKKEMRKTVHA